jgi:rhodanese-related sulfurtransferase
VLLDCRNDDERALCVIEPSLHIPMPQTPERLAEIPRDKPIIVYCHHGVRSLHVALYLKEQGLDDVRSMAGGIDRWSLQIDPAVPRYG